MSTDTILLYAMGVFALMIVGIYLTMLEFRRLTEEPSKRKGSQRHKDSARVHRGVEATDTA